MLAIQILLNMNPSKSDEENINGKLDNDISIQIYTQTEVQNQLRNLLDNMKIENCKYQEILDKLILEIDNLKIILLKMTNSEKRID